MRYERILAFSCQHLPYGHKDAYHFLRAVKLFFSPDCIVNLGDEVDNHGISFHDTNPDLMSPGAELIRAQRQMRAYYELFPECHVLESNHGSLSYRRGKSNGIPRGMIRPWEEVLDAPSGWKWVHELILEMSNGEKLLCTHHLGVNTARVSEQNSMSVVAGHQHSKLEAVWRGAADRRFFHAVAGCLIDDKSMAYEYNKLTTKRPFLGCIIIVHGNPILIPMHLNGDGRWDKRILHKDVTCQKTTSK